MTNTQFSLLTVAVIAAVATSFSLGRLTRDADAAMANLADAPLVSPTQTIEIAPGVQVFVDAETGCQYLVGSSGYELRVHSDGVPYCDDREEQAALDGYEVLPPAGNLDTDFATLDRISSHPSWRF